MRRLSAPALVMGECAYAAVSDQLLSIRGRPGRLRGGGVFRCRRCARSPPKSTLPQISLFRECLPTHVAFSLRPSMLSLFNGRGRRGSPIGDSSALRSQPPRSAAAHIVLSRNAMSVVSFTGFPALFLVLSHSPPPLDSRRPKCWEINRDLHTSMYSDVKGSVNLISQSLKYSHA